MGHFSQGRILAMWCPRCRQDVPAIATAHEQTLACVRCRQPLARLSDANIESAAGKQESSAKANADELDLLSSDQQAEIDDLLSRAEWLLGIDAAAPSRSRSAHYVAEIHGPVGAVPGHHFGVHHKPPTARRAPWVSWASWGALGVALTGFCCGGILLGWSLIANRQELWNIGETVTLASQVGLLIGLILQLERISGERRQTASRLTLLDQRVESLRSGTWTGLFGDEKSDATETMLADLKTQLDTLATRLGQRRSA